MRPAVDGVRHLIVAAPNRRIEQTPPEGYARVKGKRVRRSSCAKC